MASAVFLSFSRPAFPQPVVSGSFLPSKLRNLPCSSHTSSFISVRRRSGGSYAAMACSTGRMGLQWRNGNFSLLSFARAPAKTDTSQVLSALLPFVVALTALAALSYPSTFTWYAFYQQYKIWLDPGSRKTSDLSPNLLNFKKQNWDLSRFRTYSDYGSKSKTS